jgi:hypothetical protein
MPPGAGLPAPPPAEANPQGATPNTPPPGTQQAPANAPTAPMQTIPILPDADKQHP